MAKMIKVVFLIGKAKEMLAIWEEEKTAKKERVFFKEKGICGFKAIEAAVVDRNDVERNYCFHFLIIPEKRIGAIPKIMEKMNIEIKEVISVVSTDSSALKLINEEKRKRYSISPEYGWVVYFKNGMKTRDINEFAFSKNIVLDHLETRKKSLESQFLELVK